MINLGRKVAVKRLRGPDPMIKPRGINNTQLGNELVNKISKQHAQLMKIPITVDNEICNVDPF